MKHYFEISEAIAERLRSEMPNDIRIFQAFSENKPNELRNIPKSLHVNMMDSVFGNHAGNGAAQTEIQRWQVALCVEAPATAEKRKAFSADAGEQCLRLRKALQGFKPLPNAKNLICTGFQPLLTQDCRWRIFSFTFDVTVFIQVA